MRAVMVALAMVAAPVVAQPTKWAETVAVTPAGGLLWGNPAARVKIVEYGSFTCGHCGNFHKEGVPALQAKYLGGGQVSYEFRSFVRNAPDFAMSLMAMCLPAAGQKRLVDAAFAGQAEWTQPFTRVKAEDMQAVAALPEQQQFGRVAALGQMDGWAAAHGLAPARAQACLADKALIEKVAANRREAIDVHGLEGTPTFVLNGKTVAGAFDWAALEPAVVAALK